MNEHLVEALRRIRKNSTESNVDRRLVTNVLLSFLTTDRKDTKRFEMLNLLASILSWTDSEREKAGLQRIGSLAGRLSTSVRGASKGDELDKTDETEVGIIHSFYIKILIIGRASLKCGSSFFSRKQTLVRPLQHLLVHNHPTDRTHHYLEAPPLVLSLRLGRQLVYRHSQPLL